MGAGSTQGIGVEEAAQEKLLAALKDAEPKLKPPRCAADRKVP